MAARMPKSHKTVRAHVQMPRDWRALIDRVAKKLNISRSNFIANAAIARARDELAIGEKK